ncbi:MAG: S4 domain-containing protein [Nitrospinota bacterium]
MPDPAGTEDSGVRLDFFLQRSGILKRRSLARRFCEAGAVSVNGRSAKSGKSVHPGDRVQIDSWNRLLLVRVRSVPKKGAGRDSECYEVVEDRRKPPPDPAEEWAEGPPPGVFEPDLDAPR